MCILEIKNSLDNINSFVFTSQAGNQKLAYNEISKLCQNAKIDSIGDEGLGIITLNETYSSFFKKIDPSNLIFVRHIHPINFVIECKDNFVEKMIKNIVKIIHKEYSYSVQARIIGNNFEVKENLKNYDINRDLNFQSTKNPYFEKNVISKIVNDVLIKDGYFLDLYKPKQLISITIIDDKLYVGLSDKKHNISPWIGGKIRFDYVDNKISRAELKLKEAIETFDICIENYKTALDLGASPGGFTKVLLESNLDVASVDMASLDKFFQSFDKLKFYKMSAQNFLLQNKEKFDIITSDMKINQKDFLSILISLKDFLNDDGIIIAVLKLPKKQVQRISNKYVGILKEHFIVSAAKQLYYNKSEITICLKNKR